MVGVTIGIASLRAGLAALRFGAMYRLFVGWGFNVRTDSNMPRSRVGF